MMSRAEPNETSWPVVQTFTRWGAKAFVINKIRPSRVSACLALVTTQSSSALLMSSLKRPPVNIMIASSFFSCLLWCLHWKTAGHPYDPEWLFFLPSGAAQATTTQSQEQKLQGGIPLQRKTFWRPTRNTLKTMGRKGQGRLITLFQRYDCVSGVFLRFLKAKWQDHNVGAICQENH